MIKEWVPSQTYDVSKDYLYEVEFHLPDGTKKSEMLVLDKELTSLKKYKELNDYAKNKYGEEVVILENSTQHKFNYTTNKFFI